MRRMFSKEQIKELSKDVLDENLVDNVNQAIEDGDIEIPSGGSQLYIHHIVDSNIGYHFYLINRRETPIDFNDIESQYELWGYIIEDPYVVFYNGDSNLPVTFIGNALSGYLASFNVTENGVSSTYFDDMTLANCTDTVNPY